MIRVRNKGWTLIELIIAMVVAAVLLTIAYPAYNDQVIKSRRADGVALLYQAAQRQQQFFTINNSFTDTIGDGGLRLSSSSLEGYYTLSIAATVTSYTLTATRASGQTADSRCGDLTLNHLGVRGNLNASLPASECW